MDRVLKELREHREEVEKDFNGALELVAELQREIAGLSNDDSSDAVILVVQSLANSTEILFRKMHQLANSRSAEQARQLTVLPLSRMDHMVDSLERRLESLESRLARFEK